MNRSKMPIQVIFYAEIKPQNYDRELAFLNSQAFYRTQPPVRCLRSTPYSRVLWEELEGGRQMESRGVFKITASFPKGQGCKQWQTNTRQDSKVNERTQWPYKIHKVPDKLHNLGAPSSWWKLSACFSQLLLAPSVFALVSFLHCGLLKTVICHPPPAHLHLRSLKDLRRILLKASILTENCETGLTHDCDPLASLWLLWSKRTPWPQIAPPEPHVSPLPFWTYRDLCWVLGNGLLWPHTVKVRFHPWICPIEDLSQHLYCHPWSKTYCCWTREANHFPGRKEMKEEDFSADMSCWLLCLCHIWTTVWRPGKEQCNEPPPDTHTHTSSIIFSTPSRLFWLPAPHYQSLLFLKCLFHQDQPSSASPTTFAFGGTKGIVTLVANSLLVAIHQILVLWSLELLSMTQIDTSKVTEDNTSILF